MKKYYIQINGNVFGPYEEKKLHQMFKKGLVSNQTLVKRSGDVSFISLSHFIKTSEDKTEVYQTPPPQEKEAFPYQVNADATASHLFTSKMSGNPIQDGIEEFKKFFSTFKYYRILLIPFILASLFFVSKILYFKNSYRTNKPNFVKHTSFQKFNNELRTNFENKNHVWKFLVSSDLRNTWIASSLPGKHKAKVSFTSLPSKILSHDKIEAETEINLYSNTQEIKEWTFNKGEKFVPGFYKVKISLENRDLSFWDRTFLPSFSEKKEYETNLLIGSASKKNFMKSLKDFLKKTVKMNFTEIQEIEMKYQTLNSITKQLSDQVGTLKVPKSSKELSRIRSQFLKKYQNEYGSFFTSFVIENEKIYKKKTSKFARKKSPFATHYKEMSKIAAKIGKISAEAIDKFNRKGVQTSDFAKSASKYKSVINMTDTQLKKIKKIKNL